MDIQHDHELTVDELLDELHKAESKLTAVRAVIDSGEPSYRRRCSAAAAFVADRRAHWSKYRDEAVDDSDRSTVEFALEDLAALAAILEGVDR